ncbi:MAG TPA: VWA domain-containing protein [Solirubrobacteraceae bacterium]
MSFSSPIWLLALLLVPLAALAYHRARSRARRYAVRFPGVASLKVAAGTVPPWRRHLPAALALVALAALALALAKPNATARVPVERASIVLVTDHSGSMQATDVHPTRLEAAQRAAHTFLDQVPAQTRVGVVAFAADPDEVQAPTADHDVARRAIDAQTAQGATATGDALQVAIGLLRRDRSHPPSAIVLLSDGATTTGRDPVEVAHTARRFHIPIYTVALGSSDATVPNPDPFGPPLEASPDPATLHRISEITRGKAFTASDEGRLKDIYSSLGSQLGTRTINHQSTAAFAAGGLLLLLGAALTSQRWLGRLP